MATKQLQIQVKEADSDVENYDGEREPLLPRGESFGSKFRQGYRKFMAKHLSQKKRSIYVMDFTMFLSAVTFSIVLSSLWPYLLEVDEDSTTKFLGWVVAAYSLGQLVASPLLGAWADHCPTWMPLIAALCITVVFSVFYSYAGAFTQQHHISSWIVLISRALIGFGAGVATIVRSYVSEATTERERVGAMAGVSASQAIGFIIGPVLGLVFVPLGTEGWRIDRIKFVFNVYTGPGYLGGFLALVNIVLIVLFFRERKLQTNTNNETQSRDSRRICFCLQWNDVAACVFVILFFIILFVFSVFETIGTPLTMDEFAWSKEQAVLYNNIFYGGLAVIAILSFVVLKIITKWINEIIVLVLAIMIIFLSYIALIPMGNSYPSVMPLGVEAGSAMENISFPSLINNTSVLVGCRYSQQHWCTSVPKIYLFQYVIALVLMAVGYATASVLCYTIYSRIPGRFKKGIMMGILTAAGSLARTLGPIVVSHLYQHTGPQITFGTIDGFVLVGFLILLVSSYKMKSYTKSSKGKTDEQLLQ